MSYEIAIIGQGVTGRVMAAVLAKMGLWRKVALIEPEALPKTTHH